MKSKGITTVEIIVILLIAALAFGRIYNLTKVPPLNKATNIEKTTNTISSDKLYQNSKLGFEIKIPKTWEVDYVRSDRSISGDDLVFNIGVPESHVSVSVDPKNKSIDEIISDFNKSVVEQITNIEIDGERGKRVETREMGLTYSYVIHLNHLYTFTNMDSEILKTLRFL